MKSIGRSWFSLRLIFWEVVDVSNTSIVDKPGGLNNASAYIGLVPQSKIGVVFLVNRGEVAPSEVARNRTLPDLARIPRAPTLASIGHLQKSRP
jgi:hypothetical protein